MREVVEVSSGNESHVVTAGNASSFQRGKFLSLRRLERSEIERFQKWRTFRQVVRQKRLQRIAEIQNHKRQPWIRKHPHLGKAMRHDLDKKKIEKKKNRKILRREDR